MSSFTETPGSFTKGNGPCEPPTSVGGSIKSYTQLIEAYERLESTVQAHIAATIDSTSDPHKGQEYTALSIKDKQNRLTFDTLPRSESGNPVTSEGIKRALDTGLATKQDLLTYDDTPTTGSSNAVTSNAVATAINNVINMLSDYQPMLTIDSNPTKGSLNVVTSNGVYTALAQLATLLTEFTNNFNVTSDTVTAKKVLASVEYLFGELHADKIIDFTDWSVFSAPHAGINTSTSTDTSGAYILGMLSSDWLSGIDSAYSSKSCRAMIKHVNNFPLDAIVDAVVTYDGTKYTGTISAQVSHAEGAWEDLAFHLVEGTTDTGSKAVYLCISSSSFAYHPDEYPTIFRACGINFLPIGDNRYTIPNNIGDAAQMPICSVACYDVTDATTIYNLVSTNVYVNKLFSTTGNLAFSVEDDGTVHFAKTPIFGTKTGELATTGDIDNAMPIGAVLRWPGAVDSIPDNFHICDGSAIPLEDKYMKLAEVIGSTGSSITLPVEDCAIIRLY